MKRVAILTAFLAVVISIPEVQAQQTLSFADVLTDNMVLQRGKDVKCWGMAPAGGKVEVLLTQSRDEVVAFAGEGALNRSESRKRPVNEHPAIGKVRLAYIDDGPDAFQSVTGTTTADTDGCWEVTLGEHAASFTPTYLAARSGDARIAIQNLLIGEVWIASGQSNMEWAWTRDKMWENKGLIFNGVRYAKVRGDSYSPRDSFVEGGNNFEPWIVCEDGAVDRVSTVAYLFAQYLHRRLKVPVGVINIAQGGSFSREWCSRELLEEMNSPTVNESLKIYDAAVKADEEAKHGRGPSSLFNARLYPIRKLTTAGVIYLQGENEALAGALPQYPKTFPGVIESYRTALSSPELPFGIISLQGMGKKSGLGSDSYAVARAIHLATHKRTPHTGYIAAHDIQGGIHPNWKRPLAERAVYWALRDIYQVLKQVNRTRIKQVGFAAGKALVEFETVELKDGNWVNPKPVTPGSNDQDYIGGFMIAGADRQWFPGRVTINQGPELGLFIAHPLVKTPVALRYAWDSWTAANLGLWHDPIVPYRTDDWPIVSDDEVYDPDSGKPTASQVGYYEAHDTKNRSLELPLQLATEESALLLTRRFAHPKGILLSTVSAMQKLMQTFEVEQYREWAPELRTHALHNIPVRYWQRDKYSPARRAKWSWLIERIIRLETLPRDMEDAVNQTGLKEKLNELRRALDGLQSELEKLPDAESMDVDTMLDKVLPVMEAEKARLIEEGHDEKTLNKELNRNPF